MKDKLKMNFSKSYPEDYRRPENAEEILAGNLEIIKRIDELKAVIKKSFEKFASSMSYAKGWIQKFMRGYNLCEDLCG